MECKGCEKKFSSDYPQQKYCSRYCQKSVGGKRRYYKKTTTCERCGEASHRRFCGRSCASLGSRWKEHITLSKESKLCPSCSTRIDRRSETCSNCKEVVDLTLADAAARYDKHHRSSAYALVRSRARAVIRGLPQVCRACGYSKHTEVAHRKAISSFSPETLLSFINSPENLVLLCPNCHWEFDHGLLLDV